MLTKEHLGCSICKHCAGSGRIRSNISRTFIKCKTCLGTGNIKRSIVTDPEIQKRWVELNSSKKKEVFERLQISPQIILKPFWVKIFSFPLIWLKHYKISREKLSFFKSVRFLTIWTLITIYPNLALKLIKRKFQKHERPF